MIKKILIIIITILQIQSMFIGQYATPYNALTPILTKEYVTSWPIVSCENLLRPETVALFNGLFSSNSMTLTLGVSIYGQPIIAEVPDKTFNVAYHNLVRDWLISNEGFNPLEFNVNAQIGIFEPNGITTADSSSATIGALAAEAVSIHGDGTPEGAGQLYSPNNVRFKVEDDRQVSSFWSVAVSPDNLNAAINFNLIIFNEALANLLGQYVSDQIPFELLTESTEFQQFSLSEADRRCLAESLNLISFLNN